MLFFSRHFTDYTGLEHFSVFFHFANDMGICVFWVCPTTPMSSAGAIHLDGQKLQVRKKDWKPIHVHKCGLAACHHCHPSWLPHHTPSASWVAAQGVFFGCQEKHPKDQDLGN